MILANLSDSSRYEPLHPLFKTVFDFIKANDLTKKDLGQIELNGEDLFINNIEVKLVSKENQALEIHREYIDIHIPLDKPEIIGWKSLQNLKNSRKEFNIKDDFALYDEVAANYIQVLPGEFLIAFPEDAHAPIIGNGTLRKLIVKVKV